MISCSILYSYLFIDATASATVLTVNGQTAASATAAAILTVTGGDQATAKAAVVTMKGTWTVSCIRSSV